jgi:Cu-Zn family superoxide dismutase
MFATQARRALGAAATAAAVAGASSWCTPTPVGRERYARSAVCELGPAPGGPSDGPRGRVTFTQARGERMVRVHVRVSGVKAGLHGLHIHELGDLTRGCASAGGHFNPGNNSHGGPGDVVRHTGDLGNVLGDVAGEVDVVLQDAVISLDPASVDYIIGRSVVLHADEDDLGRGGHADSLSTGHAGARIACGVIGRAADVEVPGESRA